MPSDESAEGVEHPSVVRQCPFDGCGWEIEVERMYEGDQLAVDDADYRAERHFEKEHCGEAKIRVRLEKTIQLQPGQSLQEILDYQHDRVEDQIEGWDVAFAFGEYLEEPDEAEVDDAE